MRSTAVILAAGLGTRMKSSLPKVLHPVLGDPALLWVLRTLPASERPALVVVHHGKAKVEAALEAWSDAGLLPCPVIPVDQGEPLGTGHALQVCVAELDRQGCDQVVILSGDVPLIRAETVRDLFEGGPALLAMDLADPTGYGRILPRPDGTLHAIVEHKDASEAQRGIRRVNGGAYALPWGPLRKALGNLSNANAQREYYLTDAVAAVAQASSVSIRTCDPLELAGMNSRLDQAELQASARDRINAHWMKEGITFLAPETTLVGPRVRLGRDTLIEPSVRLEGVVTIGEGCTLGQGSLIRNAALEGGVELRPYCVVEGATLAEGAKAGPFAHLRPGTDLGPDSRIGNFVETKQARFGKGAKANHLAYVGDAEVGEGSNIGAGVITCNYDGVNKHRTVIGRQVFVGSDTQLVAPVSIGDGALIAAGSTITKDVEAGALALSRTPQSNRAEGAAKIRQRIGPKRG